MKITSFNPFVATTKLDDTVKLYEDLGFKVKHRPVMEENDFGKVEWIVMENEDGFRIDLATPSRGVNLERDVTGMRMNVDDFDEGEKFLTSKGFKMASKQPKPYETSSCKCVAFRSETGVIILLVKHKKDHE
ncbi:MAG: hypothetical protein IJT87_00435 [Ruminiclostridium sp.]|nr:hypothetical protein [Ruminiclostridium sp.]